MLADRLRYGSRKGWGFTMSQETKIFSEGMTRRSFLKRGGLGLGLFIGVRSAASGTWSMRELRVKTTSPDGCLNAFLRSFGQDGSGEIYALTADTAGPTGATGKVFKIMP